MDTVNTEARTEAAPPPAMASQSAQPPLAPLPPPKSRTLAAVSIPSVIVAVIIAVVAGLSIYYLSHV